MKRCSDNYHLIKPEQTYRKEINRRIEQAGCKIKRDSVMMVETLITASPEFMQVWLLKQAERLDKQFAEVRVMHLLILTPLMQGKSEKWHWDCLQNGCLRLKDLQHR